MDDDNQPTILNYSAPATESSSEEPPVRRFGTLLLAVPLLLIGLISTVGSVINVVECLASRDLDNAMGAGFLPVGIGCLY